MTAFIKTAIGVQERTCEVESWAHDARLRAVVTDAWAFIADPEIRIPEIECTLAFVDSPPAPYQRPPTFSAAVQMALDMVALMRHTKVVRKGVDTAPRVRPKKDRASVDETREVNTGREAIASHAAAERDWMAQRGAGEVLQSELEKVAREALLRAEKQRARK